MAKLQSLFWMVPLLVWASERAYRKLTKLKLKDFTAAEKNGKLKQGILDHHALLEKCRH